MATYQDLEVWQRSIGLIKRVYAITDTFPDKERYRLTDQMCRAVTSIPANIAEGSARKSTKDFMRFVAMALGPLAELKTHLVVAVELGYVKKTKVALVEGECEVIGKQLQALYSALGRRK